MCLAWENIAYRVLVRKPEGKRPLGRQRFRREDGIRMDLTLGRLTGIWSGSSWLKRGTDVGLL
jgi:hypothetical protein